MDIICKCGHKAEDHYSEEYITACAFQSCDCKLSKRNVYEIHIAEQQARLDTNRQQNAVMAAKIKQVRKQRDFLFNALMRISMGRGLYDETQLIAIATEAIMKVPHE